MVSGYCYCPFGIFGGVVQLKTLRVTCFSPPGALVIKDGDRLQVDGYQAGNNVRATRIQNLSKKGPTCNCSIPPSILSTQQFVGKAGKIVVDSSFIEFDLIVT